MAKVDYIKPIEALHGKIQKEDQVGYARKQLENARGVRTKFTQTYGKRTTPYSQAELDHQTYFGTICAAVAARRKDSTQKATDMANFRAQSQYTTITQYLWHICKAEYDALHPGN